MVRVLKRLGTKRALVVHGLNGMDEITVAGKSRLWELGDGEITEYDISPKDFGITEAGVETLVGGTSEENAAILRAVMAGGKGPRRDAVVLNAAAGIALRQKNQGVPALKEAVAIAIETIDSGQALEKLENLIKLSQSYG
jgi:anthranilate phosphoribosyltransferase